MGTGTLLLVTDVCFCIKSSRRLESSTPSPYSRVPALADGTLQPAVLEFTFAAGDQRSKTTSTKSLHSGGVARMWSPSGDLRQRQLLPRVLLISLIVWTCVMGTTTTSIISICLLHVMTLYLHLVWVEAVIGFILFLLLFTPGFCIIVGHQRTLLSIAD